MFTLFDFPVPVGTPATTEGTLTVEADNPSGLPQNDFRVAVRLTFGRTLLGALYAGFQAHTVVAGDTLFGIDVLDVIEGKQEVTDMNVLR